MDQIEILENLCVHDRRNPDCCDDIDDNDPRTEDCFCDNCFNGNTKLALEILRLQSELKKD